LCNVIGSTNGVQGRIGQIEVGETRDGVLRRVHSRAEGADSRVLLSHSFATTVITNIQLYLFFRLKKEAVIAQNKLDEILENREKLQRGSYKQRLKVNLQVEAVHEHTYATSLVLVHNLLHPIQNVTICELLGSGASGATVYSCYVDGFECAMKEFPLSHANDLSLRSFEQVCSDNRMDIYQPSSPACTDVSLYHSKTLSIIDANSQSIFH